MVYNTITILFISELQMDLSNKKKVANSHQHSSPEPYTNDEHNQRITTSKHNLSKQDTLSKKDTYVDLKINTTGLNDSNVNNFQDLPIDYPMSPSNLPAYENIGCALKNLEEKLQAKKSRHLSRHHTDVFRSALGGYSTTSFQKGRSLQHFNNS